MGSVGFCQGFRLISWKYGRISGFRGLGGLGFGVCRVQRLGFGA